MMTELENPSLTRSELGILEQKIILNQATAKEYEILDKFLGAMGLPNYILNKIREYNMGSYEEYVLKLSGHERNSSSQANIKGAALGVISALKSLKMIA